MLVMVCWRGALLDVFIQRNEHKQTYKLLNSGEKMTRRGLI